MQRVLLWRPSWTARALGADRPDIRVLDPPRPDPPDRPRHPVGRSADTARPSPPARRRTSGGCRRYVGRREPRSRAEVAPAGSASCTGSRCSARKWHIVDYHPDDPDFLAIGPGGIFQVTVADHGRAKVELAGDVVQVDGRRPPYVALARRDAARISQQMSAVAGRRIPVVPVVAFLGSGEIVYYGTAAGGLRRDVVP